MSHSKSYPKGECLCNASGVNGLVYSVRLSISKVKIYITLYANSIDTVSPQRIQDY